MDPGIWRFKDPRAPRFRHACCCNPRSLSQGHAKQMQHPSRPGSSIPLWLWAEWRHGPSGHDRQKHQRGIVIHQLHFPQSKVWLAVGPDVAGSLVKYMEYIEYIDSHKNLTWNRMKPNMKLHLHTGRYRVFTMKRHFYFQEETPKWRRKFWSSLRATCW